LRTAAEFLGSWKGIATGVSALLVVIGADGRQTKQQLQSFVASQSVRDSIQDERLETVDALALAECIVEQHPVVRQVLNCGDRERKAGIR
jgi:hypothetical protein